MAKWKELPASPEAIVRAALERAAETDQEMRSDLIEAGYSNLYAHSRGVRGQLVTEWDGVESHIVSSYAAHIRSLADDPTEVAAIIKKAGEDRG